MAVKYDTILDDLREDDTNFSFNFIEKKLLIPRNQQMVVYQQIIIESQLTLKGDLVLTN